MPDTATPADPTADPTTDPARALAAIVAEITAAAGALEGLEQVAALLGDAERVFVHGAGRSGLALQMTAMRLMHLGLRVHVVGDATTPAIAPGDVLLTASGSGTTGGIVRAAQSAVDAGARVAALTTAGDSPLAGLASAVIVVPAADKLDRSGAASAQYSGGLFEQVVVLTGDALFHALWKRGGASADELWPRHSNLE
ncbi:SIS domain-containing protein [Rathayibacter sp. VKM Ac-2803]|uniref:6-phospho-3-hexuloisomerase n=1 Tax=Rathayibacter sp. VKM Ac-2803 TaxID=2609256 RepID=UPI00135AC8B1|nr:6-phospho-3-hexuloisomerase [Rathayibacter sp. VKM Ac-2803]MWV47848.1 SIS domain-containing protein [Rathayibacter sp. VKM Ac-2803]